MKCPKCGYEGTRVNFCPRCKIKMYPVGSPMLKKKFGGGFIKFIEAVASFIKNVILRILESIVFIAVFHFVLKGLLFGLQFIAVNVESGLSHIFDSVYITYGEYCCYAIIVILTFKYRWPDR
ncbi:MAG: hypothetical protein PHO00_08190 [bacterium]|nr:hypothetical protein [bacterium]